MEKVKKRVGKNNNPLGNTQGTKSSHPWRSSGIFKSWTSKEERYKRISEVGDESHLEKIKKLDA